MTKKATKTQSKKVKKTLDVVEKTMKKIELSLSHTADGKELKVGMKVFILSDPSLEWTISKIEQAKFIIPKRRIVLEREGENSIKEHSTNLYGSQEKAIEACIHHLNKAKDAILRDTEESLERLDYTNKMLKLQSLCRTLGNKK